jgi:hypothetical protein
MGIFNLFKRKKEEDYPVVAEGTTSDEMVETAEPEPIEKDIQILLNKLDVINAKLESINNKLELIESKITPPSAGTQPQQPRW